MNKQQMIEWFNQFFDADDRLSVEAMSMAYRLSRELGEHVDLGYVHPSNWPSEVHLWIGPSHVIIREYFEEMMFDPNCERPYYRLSCGSSRLESCFLVELENEIPRLHRMNLLAEVQRRETHV